MDNEVKKVQLYNRYYKGLFLRQVEEGLYQLHGPDEAFKSASQSAERTEE